jgi:hypothetical protein
MPGGGRWLYLDATVFRAVVRDEAGHATVVGELSRRAQARSHPLLGSTISVDEVPYGLRGAGPTVETPT